ncbi:MAG: glucose-6-phosphate isomerase Pgi [Saliniramus fredricksonii]|uniref:Glucose-6-phosphate isomerase n=1 Tax=Saliniramus fredricksonii TaxID=1653334 RepID=A0A0N8KEV0_9HYPH|nr:glucose-6-phosphate isomerase [Saliniramus fredricksonii]KPQ12354.1 MAG: glucose-6-phosphate isomerase Pgi [Saliniramus fredricksonii]SCC81256.1 glucose-6-phosphate isomerase [Saliniramus fredricksonii]
MALRQSIEQAMGNTMGGAGIPRTAIEAALSVTETELQRLRDEEASGKLALLALPDETGDFEAIEKTARALRDGASDVVFLGTGGSSLGGQTLAQLADYMVPGLGRLADGPRIHFFDNLDPATFGRGLEALPLATTRFVAISKSGSTGETLMQTMAVMRALSDAGLKIGEHVFGLSEPRKENTRNALRDLLEPEGAPFLEHHTGIGGRYSALTNVGLLPAAVMGLDIAAIRRGAASVYAPIRAGELPARDIPVANGAALMTAAALEGKAVCVTMAYADRLERFTRWWVQLWAESLGKDGKGSQPVAAIGPVDQHSQLQLYLAGPNDKIFTVITTDCAGKGPKIDAALAEKAGEPGFAGKTIGDLVAAQGRATADTLAHNHRPTRTIHVDRLDEEHLGALMMHFMLETILTGYALGIDPFDQPAVEEGKVLAKQYLVEGAGA